MSRPSASTCSRRSSSAITAGNRRVGILARVVDRAPRSGSTTWARPPSWRPVVEDDAHARAQERADLAGAAATAHWPIATETTSTDPGEPVAGASARFDTSVDSVRIRVRVSDAASASSDARLGMNSSVQLRFSSCRLARELAADQQHLVQLQGLLHQGELEQAAGELVEERRRRGDQLVAAGAVAGVCARQVRRQGIDDTRSRRCWSSPWRPTARARPRPSSCRPADAAAGRPAPGPSGPRRPGGSAGQAARSGPWHRRRPGSPAGPAARPPGQLDQLDLADRQPDLLAEPLRSASEALSAPRSKIIRSKPALSLTQNRFHVRRPPRKRIRGNHEIQGATRTYE